MNNIYISFSPYIAKFLRKELSTGGKPIDIPTHLRSIRYWRTKPSCTYATLYELNRKPTLREMFIKALRVPGKKHSLSYAPYSLAFSEEEYKAMPPSEEKRDELVAFLLPATIPCGHYAQIPTNDKTIMAQAQGEQLHRAFIHYFYEQFSYFLHRYQQECMETNKIFTVVEAIERFSEQYDLSSNDQNAIRIQYYRHRLMRSQP